MRWLQLLRDACERSNNQRVAEDMTRAGLRISRTAISLVLNGKYPASTHKIEEKVMTLWGSVRCPFLGKDLAFAKCLEFHAPLEAPTSSPQAVRHWRACRSCPNNIRARVRAAA